MEFRLVLFFGVECMLRNMPTTMSTRIFMFLQLGKVLPTLYLAAKFANWAAKLAFLEELVENIL
jgi:hypothetical protein